MMILGWFCKVGILCTAPVQATGRLLIILLLLESQGDEHLLEIIQHIGTAGSMTENQQGLKISKLISRGPMQKTGTIQAETETYNDSKCYREVTLKRDLQNHVSISNLLVVSFPHIAYTGFQYNLNSFEGLEQNLSIQLAQSSELFMFIDLQVSINALKENFELLREVTQSRALEISN